MAARTPPDARATRAPTEKVARRNSGFGPATHAAARLGARTDRSWWRARENAGGVLEREDGVRRKVME